MKNALFGYFYGLIFALKFVNFCTKICKKAIVIFGISILNFAELQNIMKKE